MEGEYAMEAAMIREETLPAEVPVQVSEGDYDRTLYPSHAEVAKPKTLNLPHVLRDTTRDTTRVVLHTSTPSHHHNV